MKTIYSILMILAIAVSCQDQSITSVKQGIAEVNGTQLYYEMAGSGQPLVLIHGNGVDRRQWDDQFMALANDFQVIRYDVRGFGKSAMPVLGEKYGHHDDLKALLDYLEINKAHICGSSMGAGIAADFCLANPEYCLSLISAGPWVFGYYSPAAKDLYSVMDSVGKVFKKDGAKAASEHWIGNAVFSNSFQNAKTKEQMMDIGKDYSFWHFLNKNPGIVVQPLAAKQLEKLTLPTLIITSENDLEACKEVGNLMNEKIGNSKMVIMEDAGHCMNMDKPGRFNEILTDFINDL